VGKEKLRKVWSLNMKCDLCQHQRVCWMYKDHISKIVDGGIQITIDKCREFDEVR